jgi:hypothetical protein
MALNSLLSSFAPGLHTTRVGQRVLSYLQRCGVALPDAVSEGLDFQWSADHDPTNPSTTLFEGDLLPYELALGQKSCGIVLGHCPYNNGRPTLLIDFPVVVLVLLKLRTTQARQLQSKRLPSRPGAHGRQRRSCPGNLGSLAQ